MIIAPFMRRWGIFVVGGVFLLLGLVILSAHFTFAFEWGTRPPLSDMAFYPGILREPGALNSGSGMVSAERYANLSAQISIALGITLLAGWLGYALGKSSALSRRRQVQTIQPPCSD